MNKMKKLIIFCVTLLLPANGTFYSALADHDEHKERRRYQKRDRDRFEHQGNSNLMPVSNSTYGENCGACHFAYQPELLPSGSWQKILAGLEDHFGETVALDSESERIIAEYLNGNAADRSSEKKAVKIMKCLGSEIPLRITEIPYIKKAHHEISRDVLKRESIGSLSNCSACHTTAEKGIYEDDDVTIPR